MTSSQGCLLAGEGYAFAKPSALSKAVNSMASKGAKGKVVVRTLVRVAAAYDPEARVWYVEDSDLPGVNAWAPTVEELLHKLPGVVLDLLEAEGRGDDDEEVVPIELVARAHTSARWGTAP